MKKIIANIFVITLLNTPIINVYAYDPYYPGSVVNPLRVQIVPDPMDSINQQYDRAQQELKQKMQQDQLDFERWLQNTQQAQNQNGAREENLKGQYGLSNYYDCRSSTSACKGDLSNPADASVCVSATQSCLESKSLRESYTKKWDQECRNLVGPYGRLGSVDTVNKKYSCACQVGYEPDQNSRQCVPLTTQNATMPKQTGILCNGTYWSSCPAGKNFVCPQSGDAYCEVPKTNDQVCIDGIGKNSKWNGTKTNDGKLNCDCQTGYSWNGTACIVVTPIIPPKTSEQICKDGYPNSFFTGVLNDKGWVTCDCKTGYNWNATQTACVPIPSPNGTDGATFFTSSLARGGSGNEVKRLQEALSRFGFFQGEATGYFGPKTERAVRQYQQSKGLEAVGIVGPKTRLLLNGD